MLQGGQEMKFKLFIDKNHDDEVIVYAHEESELTKQIEDIVTKSESQIVAYIDREAVVLELADVYCFVVEDNKVFAITSKDKLKVKSRLYQLEEMLPHTFVKVNQSCIANIKMIKSFDSKISGSLLVRFKNGYSDYVSRRQLKVVKERMGL